MVKIFYFYLEKIGKCYWRLICIILLRLTKELNLDLDGGVHVQLARVNCRVFLLTQKKTETGREKKEVCGKIHGYF